MSIKIKDINHVAKLQQAVVELSKHKLQIGIFAKDDSFIAMIANVNEFGATIRVTDKMRGFLGAKGINLKKSTSIITIPERSFMREGFESCKGQLEELANKLIPKVLHFQMSPKELYSILGEFAVGEIKQYLTDLKTPPNSPVTVKMKRSSNPLIDTGRLRNSITYKVV